MNKVEEFLIFLRRGYDTYYGKPEKYQIGTVKDFQYVAILNYPAKWINKLKNF